MFGFVSHGGHVTFLVQLSSRAPLRGEHGGVGAVPLGAALLREPGRRWLVQGAVAAGVVEDLGCGPLGGRGFWDGAGGGPVGRGHPLFRSETAVSVHELVLSTAQTRLGQSSLGAVVNNER